MNKNSIIRLAGVAVLAGLAAPTLAQTAAERLELPEPEAREGRTITVNGADIFVAASGEGEPVLLLHGYPLSGALFERLRDRLDDTYQVITIDHRGYGRSSTPAPVEDVATYAEDALAVLSELGIDRAVIGGMSMGGPIAFEMYRQNPDVFAGMMLIDTNHTAAGAIEAGIWQGAETTLEEKGSVEAIIPFLMPNMLTGETRTVEAPAQVDYLTAAMKQASLDGAIGGAKVLAGRPDSTETLKGVDVPVLVLVGRADPVYPVEIAQEMADLAPDGELAIIDGASHAAVFEQPEAAGNAIGEFLGRVY
ncbi:alpha/beta fold hydrolase [Acuticoccus sp.]|uniref:alpha/beta fold hydrolase n=1 Tax=Acuticoccus sp. TaxID=1904378 RepID=UPI003B528300